MNINIDYEQALFIKNHAVHRLTELLVILSARYRTEEMPTVTDKQYAEFRVVMLEEVQALKLLVLSVCEYCDYDYHGKDTDGTRWYSCKVHGENAPSPDAPCAGYVEEPYILKQLKSI